MPARIALIVGLVLVMSREAEALRAPHFYGLTPADGAVDVPTNAVLLVEAHYAQADMIRLEDAEGLRLATTLELIGDVSRWTIRLRPLDELRANHTYSIVTEFRGAEDRRTFRTGSGPDTSAPPAIRIGDPRLMITENGVRFGCGPFHDVVLDLQITEATQAASYLVTVDGGEPTVVLAAEWDLFGEERDVAFDVWRGVDLHPRRSLLDEVCMTIRPRDLAGNLGPARHVCVPVNPADRARGRGSLTAVMLIIVSGVSAVVWTRRRRRHILV